LKVTQGLIALISANPLCLIPSSISRVSCFTSLENPCATKVAPAASASWRGLTGLSMFFCGDAFVEKPRSLVGEICPLVSPYTWLSMTMYVMSGLRRTVCRKCPMPMA